MRLYLVVQKAGEQVGFAGYACSGVAFFGLAVGSSALDEIELWVDEESLILMVREPCKLGRLHVRQRVERMRVAQRLAEHAGVRVQVIAAALVAAVRVVALVVEPVSPSALISVADGERA